MTTTLHDDGMVTFSGIDGIFRPVGELKPSVQMFNDDGWNQDVTITSCPKCRTFIPPFTRWNFCPGCGVKFKWDDGQ